MATLTSMAVSSVLLGVLAYAVFQLAVFMKSFIRRRRLIRKFPTDAPSFIFGHLFDYPGPNDAGLAYQREQITKFPRTSVMWLMNMPMLLVSHPTTISIILKSSEPKGPFTYDLIRPWIGDGLLTSKGDKWYRNRRLLTPAFHFEILKQYVDIKNRCADILVDKFIKAAESTSSFRVFSNIAMYSLDVILKCSMSYETDCQLPGNKHPYVKAVNILSEIMVARFFQPWFHNDYIFSLTPSGRTFFKQCKYVHQVAETIIKKRQAELKQEGNEILGKKSGRCLDFLDTLITARDENGVGLTFREIRDEVDTFLFEGHDTTSSAISWSLYSIAGHPDVQRRVQQEIDALLDGKDRSDVTWEDLYRLPYLTMVVKEAMRLHTPVPFIQRILTTDTEIDGKTAPAGTLVNCVLYNLHHNPTVWPDSLKFDPDRFLPENVEKRHPYSFVPFSAGPRNCIGQNFAMDEIKIILARILRRVTIRLDPDHKVEKFEGVVMRAQNDIRLLVSRR